MVTHLFVTWPCQVTAIERGDYVLPAIQREFVWKPEQICRLFDSIMQEIPFGTILFWRGKPASVEVLPSVPRIQRTGRGPRTFNCGEIGVSPIHRPLRLKLPYQSGARCPAR